MAIEVISWPNSMKECCRMWGSNPRLSAYQASNRATTPGSRLSAFWFQRRRFFKVFTIYGHGSHIGHVTWRIWANFRSPIPWRLHMKSDWLAKQFLRRRCLKVSTSSDDGGVPILQAHQWAFSMVFPPRPPYLFSSLCCCILVLPGSFKNTGYQS